MTASAPQHVFVIYIQATPEAVWNALTDPAMTRFNITLQEGVEMVLHALDRAIGGEVFVPKIPSYRITDVAQAIGPDCRHEIVGIRPGEKIHEEMITWTDGINTVESEDYYIIAPSLVRKDLTLERYLAHHGARKVPAGFSYSSGENREWLSVGEIKALIREHVDPTFPA